MSWPSGVRCSVYQKHDVMDAASTKILGRGTGARLQGGKRLAAEWVSMHRGRPGDQSQGGGRIFQKLYQMDRGSSMEEPQTTLGCLPVTNFSFFNKVEGPLGVSKLFL